MKRSIAILLVAFFGVVAVAAAAVAGTYSGKTVKQHQPITATLSSTGMDSASYQALYTCRKGRRVSHSSPQGTDLPQTNWAHGRTGHIDARYKFFLGTNNRPDRVHFVASVNRRGHLVGWFNETYVSFGLATCHSGTVHFNLARQ